MSEPVGDTHPDNPVSSYPPEVHPIGAVLTIIFGGTEHMYCTLGQLYRALGWLTGDVPLGDAIDDAIAAVRGHVRDEHRILAVMAPPPDNADDTEKLLWLASATIDYGPTVILTPHPDKGADDAPPELP